MSLDMECVIYCIHGRVPDYIRELIAEMTPQTVTVITCCVLKIKRCILLLLTMLFNFHLFCPY